MSELLSAFLVAAGVSAVTGTIKYAAKKYAYKK